MNRIVLLLTLAVAVATVSAASATDTGMAQSRDELQAVKQKLIQKIKDYNLTRRPNDSQWGGVFCFCVCAQDRSRIIWATDVTLSRDSGGQVP